MRGLVSTATLSGVLALVFSMPASAASDITVAAIATGRLYVVGTTDRPHTAVILDKRFKTESDENRKFQYELVYHPANCVVSAAIDGTIHEAVVSNCGQQVVPGTWLDPKPAMTRPTPLERVLSPTVEVPSTVFCPSVQTERSQDPARIELADRTPPVFTVVTGMNFSPRY
ncbi:hypothetical protein SAMN02799625_05552 [Methylobacterium sp. UNC300MFChir4.1]|jgi:hypothetical protein|uniref:hypothetical protein n=1 Tax=unclassified Methylobacterium TaxID=2615210 RepID=UPI0008A7DDE2|nr:MULTISPECIES: hypothetical protein [unclassified Methylobacterium]SEH25319.1 hypothetical protein SAMN02799636_00104 [Methylobacterium sp. 275MFSha3.1]SEP33351.1 hypothetical protein SAMN02799625_05552 [Methylobacterium sp. UNC300MFChir4.1]